MQVSEIRESHVQSFTRASRLQNFIEEDDLLVSNVRLDVDTVLTDETEDHSKKSAFKFYVEYADRSCSKGGFLFKSIKTPDGATEITYNLERGSDWLMKDVDEVIESFTESEPDQMSPELQEQFKLALSVEGIKYGQFKDFLLVTGQNHENVYLFMVYRSATDPNEDYVEFFHCDNKEIERVELPNRKLDLEKKESGSMISTKAGSSIIEFEEDESINKKNVDAYKTEHDVIQKNTPKSSHNFLDCLFKIAEIFTGLFHHWFNLYPIFQNSDHSK